MDECLAGLSGFFKWLEFDAYFSYFFPGFLQGLRNPHLKRRCIMYAHLARHGGREINKHQRAGTAGSNIADTEKDR